MMEPSIHPLEVFLPAYPSLILSTSNFVHMYQPCHRLMFIPISLICFHLRNVSFDTCFFICFVSELSLDLYIVFLLLDIFIFGLNSIINDVSAYIYNYIYIYIYIYILARVPALRAGWGRVTYDRVFSAPTCGYTCSLPCLYLCT